MVEGLRSKSVNAKDENEKGEDFAKKFQQMQDQIQELVLESRMARKDKLEQRDFVTRLVEIEAKLDNQSVGSISNPLYMPYQQDQ